MINWLTYSRRSRCHSRIDFWLRTSSRAVRLIRSSKNSCFKRQQTSDFSANHRNSRRFYKLKEFNYTLISPAWRGRRRRASPLTLPLRFNRVCRRPAWRPFVRDPSVGDTWGPRSALAQTDRGGAGWQDRPEPPTLQSVPVWVTHDTDLPLLCPHLFPVFTFVPRLHICPRLLFWDYFLPGFIRGSSPVLSCAPSSLITGPIGSAPLMYLNYTLLLLMHIFFDVQT